MWTMTDLLQLNADSLPTYTPKNSKTINPPVDPINSKKPSIAQFTKRPIINEVRIVQLQATKTATILSSKKHKISAVLDANANSSKRMKASNGLITNTKSVKTEQRQQLEAAPQLLQQLMAPMPSRVRLDEANQRHGANAKWTQDSAAKRGPLNADTKLPLQPSNSVLKNLLVSGCDVSAGYICTVPIPIHQKKVARA